MPPLRSLYVTPPSDTPTMGPVTTLQRLRDMYESLLPKDFPPTQVLRDYVLPTSDVMPMTTLVPGGRVATAVAEEAAPAVRQTLKAFHGSPHDFGTVGERGAFTKSAIGSGEGGQAYGYGHYFAENPQVAADYRKKLADGFKIDGKGYEASTTRNDAKPGNYAANALSRFNGDVGAAAQWLENDGVPYEIEAAKMLRKAKSIENWEGHGYELNLHTSPESLLDWDKPLSQQPKKVIDWLRQSDAPFGYKAKSKNWRGSGALPDDVWLKSLENTTGEELYQALVAPKGRVGHTEGIASQQLADAGIHGVQYLDQGSRGIAPDPAAASAWKQEIADLKGKIAQAAKGEDTEFWQRLLRDAEANHAHAANPPQTRNYVIFPHFEHLIEISKKYGISLPAAASLYKWQQSQKGVE